MWIKCFIDCLTTCDVFHEIRVRLACGRNLTLFSLHCINSVVSTWPGSVDGFFIIWLLFSSLYTSGRKLMWQLTLKDRKLCSIYIKWINYMNYLEVHAANLYNHLYICKQFFSLIYNISCVSLPVQTLPTL